MVIDISPTSFLNDIHSCFINLVYIVIMYVYLYLFKFKFNSFWLGSARLGSARLGSARLGSARLGSARLGSARLGSARLGSARLGSARLGSARLGSARLGKGFKFGALEWMTDFTTSGMSAEYLIQFRVRRICRCGPSDFHFWETAVFVYRN